MIRYRVGIDRWTGKPLVGLSHVQQNVTRIVRTLPEERVMLLGYGCDIVRSVGRNMVAPEVLDLYTRFVVAVHRWEPEYRIRRVQLVTLSRAGGLGLAFAGLYFPEGRFGNFEIVEEQALDLTLVDQAVEAAA